ncbi:MAG: hypothetical protein JWP58_3134 [Hymenobacter sp.]|nr:hypothetical protein [Hymenobacter sp.]
MAPIWKTLDVSDSVAADQPLAILQGYADQLAPDTQQRFEGVVTDTVRDDTTEVFYALYITAPKLRNYMYRLLEVQVRDLSAPYAQAVTVRFFAKDPRNNRKEDCDSAEELRTVLLSYIESPLTQGILTHLEQLIDIVQDQGE